MAHLNEREYLRQFLAEWLVQEWPAPLKEGRVLSVGSAEYGHGIEYQSLFPGMSMVGVDQIDHPSVDVVCDLTGDCEALKQEQFSAILCCSVLEHCQAPWLLAANLMRHLKPEGLLYVTVPWVWRYHAYPNDYWRMSAEGVKLLFPEIHWKKIAYASQAPGEFIGEGLRHDDGAPYREIRGQRVYLMTQFVCMIGRKKA